jgi:hypothetical protein
MPKMSRARRSQNAADERVATPCASGASAFFVRPGLLILEQLIHVFPSHRDGKNA